MFKFGTYLPISSRLLILALSIKLAPIDVIAVGDSNKLSVRLRAVTSIFSNASCFAVVLVSSAFTEVVRAATIARLNCESLRSFKIFSKGYRKLFIMHLLVQPVSFGHKKRCVVASFLWKGIILHNCEFMYLFFDKSKNVPNGGKFNTLQRYLLLMQLLHKT